MRLVARLENVDDTYQHLQGHDVDAYVDEDGGESGNENKARQRFTVGKKATTFLISSR